MDTELLSAHERRPTTRGERIGSRATGQIGTRVGSRVAGRTGGRAAGGIGGRATGRIGSRVAASALLSAAVASLLLAVPPLRGVARQVAHMDLRWVIVAATFELASCLSFVVIFRLFFDDLPAPTAREVAWTEEGSGALLPGGGIGGLAIGGWLLRQAGMSSRSIIDRSSALFFLTSAVNVAALVSGGVALAAGGAGGAYQSIRAGAPILAGLIATGAVLAIPSVIERWPRRAWPGWMIDLAAGIARARGSLRRPSWRLVGAVGYLGFDIAALGAAFTAAGRPVALGPLVLGYVIGYLANLIPIPGGFGVLEGGLAATLIAYGAPATQAAAAVVVYHAIAFWIPSLGGLAGYARLRRRLGQGDVSAAPRPARPCGLALVHETSG